MKSRSGNEVVPFEAEDGNTYYVTKKRGSTINLFDGHEVFRFKWDAREKEPDYDNSYPTGMNPNAYQVAVQWYKANPALAPKWHTAKEGTWWALTLQDGTHVIAVVVGQEFTALEGTGCNYACPLDDPYITQGTRIGSANNGLDG